MNFRPIQELCSLFWINQSLFWWLLSQFKNKLLTMEFMAPKDTHFLVFTPWCSPLPHGTRVILCGQWNMAEVPVCDF